MKIYYVYILECSDNTYYTGIISSLTNRFESHQSGSYEGSYTSSRTTSETCILLRIHRCEYRY